MAKPILTKVTADTAMLTICPAMIMAQEAEVFVENNSDYMRVDFAFPALQKIQLDVAEDDGRLFVIAGKLQLRAGKEPTRSAMAALVNEGGCNLTAGQEEGTLTKVALSGCDGEPVLDPLELAGEELAMMTAIIEKLYRARAHLSKNTNCAAEIEDLILPYQLEVAA